MAQQTDRYANVMNGALTMNGATLVFDEMQTGISLGQGYAVAIDEINYYYNAADMNNLADQEALHVGLSVSNSITGLSVSNNQVIHSAVKYRNDFGVAANAVIWDDPQPWKFSPPLIVAAPKIYFVGYGPAGSANSLAVRVFFRYVKLTTQEYLEIAESFVLVG